MTLKELKEKVDGLINEKNENLQVYIGDFQEEIDTLNEVEDEDGFFIWLYCQ